MSQEQVTRECWEPTSPEDKAEIRLVLDDVLKSAHFAASKRYPALLRYVVEQTLEGFGDQLKERTVGVEVFGRKPDYDTNLDTSVRFSASEVRKRLADYNRGQIDAPVQIGLNARSFRPEFTRRVMENLASISSPAESTGDTPAANPQRKWSIPTSAMIIILSIMAVLGCFFVFSRLKSRESFQLWKSLTDQKNATVICLGGDFFPGSYRSNDGTVLPNQAVINPYLSFENGVALSRVTSAIALSGGQFRIEPAANLILSSMRDNPVVVIGAYNNQWTDKLLESAPIRFRRRPNEEIVDTSNPGRTWRRDIGQQFTETPDYGLVSRFWSPVTNNYVVVIAGLQRFGTDAASQFVGTPHLAELLDTRLGRHWKDKNFSIVLRVDVVNGRAGAPTIEDARLW